MNILVAGLGNSLLGDDGFGVEVARELLTLAWPPQVAVEAFGIRGHDLARACARDYQSIVFVDAVPRGDAAGAVYVVEPDPATLRRMWRQSPAGPALDPLAAVQSPGLSRHGPPKVFLVGCAPGPSGGGDTRRGLSPALRAAVTEAARAVHALVSGLLNTAAMAA